MKSAIENYVVVKVRQMRIESGISQTSLAKLLNVTTGFIGQVESKNNSAKYNLNHLNELAKIFNCSLSEFFPEEHLSKELAVDEGQLTESHTLDLVDSSVQSTDEQRKTVNG